MPRCGYFQYKPLRTDSGGPFNVSRVILAAVAYVAASIYDTLLTLNGLKVSGMSELNPIVAEYMRLFGQTQGIITLKLIMGIGLILGVAIFDLTAKRDPWYMKASNFLLVASAIMILGSSFWLLDKPINIF